MRIIFQRVKLLAAHVWLAFRPNTIRRAVAGVMIIMALGRLGLYESRPLSDILTDSSYGILLLVLGVLLYIGHDWHYKLTGRFVAAAGAVLLGTMAWDAASISFGTTALIEFWLSFLLVLSAFSDSDCA